MDFRKQVSTPATSAAPHQGGTSIDLIASYPPGHFPPGTAPRQPYPLTPPQYLLQQYYSLQMSELRTSCPLKKGIYWSFLFKDFQEL